MEVAAVPVKARKKSHRPEALFRHALDACSRNKDLSGALTLLESADAQNIHLTSYHFNSLLHILSNSIETLEDNDTRKTYVFETAFKVFDRMVSSGATPTEATITTMARVASCRPDIGGDMAFDLVKSMEEKYGATPKLRTYDPALMEFCRSGKSEKAYSVEEHMLSYGIVPEEPEVAGLLEVSAKNGDGERVYGYLQKLRSCVGCAALSTADVLESWFSSEPAAHVGKPNWDAEKVNTALCMNGGGWHGLGWLGKGKWKVLRGRVNQEGHCYSCGQRLACVDIDQRDREKFAESVASLAVQRDKKENFMSFQEWLDSHGTYKAVIDGANVALYQQNFVDGEFSLLQLNAVVTELKERFQGKWPLVILHRKRYCKLMENPSNRQLLETWSGAGAIYTTPVGSNDDWYWLYAAVKLKSLLVTNDEMRDHIYELLGSNFFPKWKERHQVKYTFRQGRIVLKMPPPYSLVIQESERGSWHVPLCDSNQGETPRIWLCITRQESCIPPESGFLTAESTTDSLMENGSIMQKPLQPHHETSAGSIAGKRKERSP